MHTLKRTTARAKRLALVMLATAALIVSLALPAAAYTCGSGKTAWISAYNSTDGSYKYVYYQYGYKYFPGTGTDQFSTGHQSNSYVSIISNSGSSSYYHFCVPNGAG